MERGKTTNFILRQFKRKSKRILSKDSYTELFLVNKERDVVEFLTQDDNLVANLFFKEFLPNELKDFVEVKIHNEDEQPIKTWYYNDENLVLIISINWGKKQHEISIDIDIESFAVTYIDENKKSVIKLDYNLLSDHIISFLTIQARKLAKEFKLITKEK